MKKPLLAICIAFFFCHLRNSNAQVVQNYCGSARYDTEIFSAVTIESDTAYGSNADLNGNNVILTMDIYQPTGDTATIRPLIVWAHGGSFLGGSKNDGDVTSLCNHFAKRGYVCVSINYRLGVSFPPSQASATRAVFRAVQDMKAAIRFFRKDAATGNTYKIDPDMIFAGGSSAGAFMALHLAYLNQPSELPSQIDTTVLGGLEGASGNPGYPSTVNAVINLCGALGDTAWMIPGDVPVCSMHGTTDNIVPYATAMLSISVFQIMVVDGSYSIGEHANMIGVPNAMYTYFGQGHVPYSGNIATMDTTVRFVSNFLYAYLGCTPVDPIPLPNTFTSVPVAEINSLENDFSVYPNPSRQNIYLRMNDASARMLKISLIDFAGRTLFENTVETNREINIPRQNIAAGMYLLKVHSGGNETVKKICFE